MTLLLALVLLAAQGVQVVEDVPYKDGPTDYEKERCKLDLYVPEGAKGAPVLLWFHGGGLTAGDKKGGGAYVGRRFAAEGFLVASANYRLSPKAAHPAYVEDAAAAVAWMHRNAAGHGGDPGKLFVAGHSAGGYLSAIVASDPSLLGKHGLETSILAGAIPISGQMDCHTAIRKERGLPAEGRIVDATAPLFHARKDAPPFLLVAGGDDLPGRAAQSVDFHRALVEKGHPDVSLLIVGKRNHVAIGARLGRPDDPVAAALLNFVRERTGR